MIDVTDLPTLGGFLAPFGIFLWFLRYQNGLISLSDKRATRVEARLALLERKSDWHKTAELICEENLSTLRRALILAGVEVPALRPRPLPLEPIHLDDEE